MIRSVFAALVAVCLVVVPRPLGAQREERLAGTWTLNRSLSEFPKEVGFSPEWLEAGTVPGSGAARGSSGGGGGGGRGGGRGGRGGGSGGSTGGAAGYTAPRESADDAARNRLLTAEVRNPQSRLTIVDVAEAITITDDG